MAANDITISLAATSTSIKVTKLVREGKDRTADADDGTTIAAGASAVFTLGNLDSLVIERTDAIAKHMAETPLKARKGHGN